MATTDSKLLFLKEVLLRKEVIFGSFNSIADGRKRKKASWNDIHSIMVANGCDKSVEYLSIFWKNLRTATLKKVDNPKRTGTEGGRESKLTELDDFVLQIIGKESPIVEGIDVKESEVFAQHLTPPVVKCSSGATYADLSGPSATSSCAATCEPSASHLLKAHVLATPVVTKERKPREMSLSERDILLNENLRLRNKKLKLEILIYKRQLSMDSSDSD